MMTQKKIKVLIVDDSEIIRKLLTQILDSDNNIEIVGTAVDPFDAREKIKDLNPDVITLDIEMPRMDGITFLGNLMRLRPMPVVMISTLTQKGADATLKALELGAVDFIAKPQVNVNANMEILASEIIEKVVSAAQSNINVIEHNANKKNEPATPAVNLAKNTKRNTKVDLIAIGASTGGTEATKEVLRNLPESMPPIVIVQHMPAGFTASYAERLNSQCKLSVVEFNKHSGTLEDNHVYLANGAFHMQVFKRKNIYKVMQNDDDPVNRHKPSVDVLFNSIAAYGESKAVAVILTGMGVDGAAGMVNLRAQGAYTIAQDEQTSIVWGMPRAAVEQDAAREVLPLNKIANRLTKLCYG